MNNYKAIVGGVPTCGHCMDAMKCAKNDSLLVCASNGDVSLIHSAPLRRGFYADVFECKHCEKRTIMVGRKELDLTSEEIERARSAHLGVIELPTGKSVEHQVPSCGEHIGCMKCIKCDAIIVCAKAVGVKNRWAYRAGVFECQECNQRVIRPQPAGFALTEKEVERYREEMGEWVIDMEEEPPNTRDPARDKRIMECLMGGWIEAEMPLYGNLSYQDVIDLLTEFNSMAFEFGTHQGQHS